MHHYSKETKEDDEVYFYWSCEACTPCKMCKGKIMKESEMIICSDCAAHYHRECAFSSNK